MVKRNHAIDFASGALVFPGGKLADGDFDPALAQHLRPGGLDPSLFPYALGAIREAFEESGLLLARARGSEAFLPASRIADLDEWRPRLNAGAATLRDLAEAAQVEFALDVLIPFAHWITPEGMPKRFDTWFFLAPAPADQIGQHDGDESVDSEWINPNTALAEYEAKRRTIVFPTRMQLLKLGRAASVAEARASAGAAQVITVMPVIDRQAPGEPHLRIPLEAGYGVTAVPLSSVGI